MEKPTLGTTIASLRKQQGLTQLELAQKMGVTDKAVSKWERDLSCPDVSSPPKLAGTLGVSVDELMQAKQKKEEKGEKPAGASSPADIILRGIALAMGIAVVVLGALGELDNSPGLSMLGIGLVCLAIASFRQKR